MQSDTEQQRFLGTLLGNPTDRFPYFDLEPDADTLKRWRRQGFPRWRAFAAYFELEPHHDVGPVLRSYPFYRKAPDILTDPTVFDRYYDPDQRARFPNNLAKKVARLRRQGRVLYVNASGGGLLQMLGVGDWASFHAACRALIQTPRQVAILLDKITDFYCICLERVLSKVSVDYASFYEPIAANTAPVISPAMFQRFALPGYRKVLRLLDRHEVPLRILCTTGGNLGPLLPLLIDAGINGLWISNIRSAGMTYKNLRNQFGPDIALIGGIDATALAKDPAAVRKVVEDTVPELLHKGRYLPCLDDRPRSNMPFANYRLFRRRLSALAH
ncbi:MAG: uroporphyrinogen decarboxylase family protein [Desulfosarcinaceae bacterium]|nr:uroporphyrinogen decarboxylase family protein [Desulfosarcinaceae bacterium]